MQIMNPHLKTFRAIPYALATVLLMASQGIAETKGKAESAPINLTINQQVLIDREKQLVDDHFETFITTSSIEDKEKEVLFDDLSLFGKRNRPISLYSNTFAYSSEQKFNANPIANSPVNLPPQPLELSPFGPPKKELKTEQPNQATEENKEIKEEAETEKQEEDKSQEEVNADKKKKDKLVAVSPFLNWIRSSKNGEAEKNAKKTLKEYERQQPKEDDGGISDDVFLNIRFPYSGTEPPPSSSAAIYSTPEK